MPMYGFDSALLPFTESKDFQIVSIAVADQRIYGVLNKITGHVEMMFGQLSQAVIQMQTAQQTFDRVKTGEANGYSDYGTNIHTSQG
jgi:hypothetical protein